MKKQIAIGGYRTFIIKTKVRRITLRKSVQLLGSHRARLRWLYTALFSSSEDLSSECAFPDDRRAHLSGTLAVCLRPRQQAPFPGHTSSPAPGEIPPAHQPEAVSTQHQEPRPPCAVGGLLSKPGPAGLYAVTHSHFDRHYAITSCVKFRKTATAKVCHFIGVKRLAKTFVKSCFVRYFLRKIYVYFSLYMFVCCKEWLLYLLYLIICLKKKFPPSKANAESSFKSTDHFTSWFGIGKRKCEISVSITLFRYTSILIRLKNHVMRAKIFCDI